MRCPLCGHKAVVQIGLDGHPSFTCPTIVMPDQSNKQFSHYEKGCGWNDYYREEAVVLPFKIVNSYENSDYRKPHCKIYKYQMVETTWWRGFDWVEIMHLNYTLEVLRYKKMRNRLNNIILFS